MKFSCLDNWWHFNHLGQSIGRVEPCSNGKFKITISNSFEPKTHFSKTLKKQAEISFNIKDNIYTILVQKPSLYFTTGYLKEICKGIEKYNFQKEKQWQQKILADNVLSPKLFIIDSEVKFPIKKGGRLDLLGIKKDKNDEYYFVIIELKLTDNKEAEDGSVIEQINNYEDYFKNNISYLKSSYEINYQQKKELGLFNDDFKDKITIKEDKIEKVIIIADGYNRARKIEQKLYYNGFEGKIIPLKLSLEHIVYNS